MKHVDGWWWPDREHHMIDWMRQNRMVLNGRSAYQGKKQVAALKHCKNFRVAVDVGAHIGLWSYNLAHQFATVFSAEPVAEHQACFKKNVTGQFVHLLPYALGAEEAMVSIRANASSTGDSWVDGPGAIPQRTLDSLEIPDVDFIKIDAEGYEELILRGGIETLKACRPVVCVEQKRDMACKFGLKPQGAVEFLKSLGYSVAQELGGDYIMVP